MAETYDPIRDKQIDRNAQWARTFRETAAGDTDQDRSRRRLYEQDISDAVKRDENRRAAEFESLQLQNPEVGRLVLQREKADRDARNQVLTRDLNERKFRWQQEKDNLTNEINHKRQELQLMQEQRLFQKAKRETEDSERIQLQTAAVEDGEAEMRSFGLFPGTEGYAAGLASLLKDNPYIDNGYRKLLLDQAFIEQDPAEASAAIARGGKVTTIVDPGTGKKRFTISEQGPEPQAAPKTNAYRDRDFYAKERNRLETVLSKTDPKRNPGAYAKVQAERDDYARRVTEADNQIRGQTATTEQPTAAPSAKIRMKSPDGEIRLVDPASVDKYKSKGATIVD
jgi:hypothetical protein